MGVFAVLFGLLAAALILVAFHGLFVRPRSNLRLLSILGLLFAAASWLTLIPMAISALVAEGYGTNAFHLWGLSGPYAWALYFLLFLPVLIAQAPWLRRVRLSPRLSLVFALSSFLVWLTF